MTPKQGQNILLLTKTSTNTIQNLDTSFKSEILHSLQNRTADIVWAGEVKEAESVDEFITSASATRDSVQDFENLDFKKASGVRKLVTGRGKAQSGKSLISGKRIVWMSCDATSRKLLVTMKSSWTSGINEMFNAMNENVQAFRHKVGRNTINSH